MPDETKYVNHPCVMKGMKHVAFWMDGDRHQKFKKYCNMKGVSMTDLLTRFVISELANNYDDVQHDFDKAMP